MSTLDVLLSPTYTHSDATGALLDRASWLAYAGRRVGRATQIAFRDTSIRIDGDVAIVTGVNEITGTGARNPSDASAQTLRFTQVWIWKDNRWLREAFQATPVEPTSGKFT